MMRALMISATGMTAQQLAMDTISNNLANVNTTGFKTSQATFADIFSRQVGASEGVNETGAGPSAVGLGVRTAEIEQQFTQGQIESTGNPMDLAIQGNGFFQVLRPDGSFAYTRDGSFTVNAEGVLSTSQGYAVSPEVQLPQDVSEIQIAADGTVRVKRAGQGVARPVAQLELAQFVNPNGLITLGNNLFAATEASGEALAHTPGQDGLGTVMQGSLERSNVNLVQEMVNLIMTQRAYEVNTRSIQAADEMMKMTNNLRRV